MNFRLSTFAILLCFFATTASGQESAAVRSASANSIFQNESQRVDAASNRSLKLVHLNTAGTPHILVGNIDATDPLLSTESRSDVQSVRTNVLEYVTTQLKPILNIAAEASMKESGTRKVGTTWHSTYHVEFNGVRLRDHYVHVNTGILNGKVVMVRSDIPGSSPNVNSPVLTSDDALQFAQSAYSSEFTTQNSISEQPKLVYVSLPTPKDIRLAYETTLFDGLHQWRYTIDAVSGAVLQKLDMIQCNYTGDEVSGPGADHPLVRRQSKEDQTLTSLLLLDGGNVGSAATLLSGTVRALVHLTKPTDSLTPVLIPFAYVTVNGVRTLTDSNGVWHSSANYPVTIRTSFSGPYERVVRNDGGSNASFSTTVTSGSLDVLWTDANSNAAERDAFYAVGRARIHALAVDTSLSGFSAGSVASPTPGLTTQLITVNVNIAQACNAYYDPSTVSLNFFASGSSGGTSCVNTAEIADVVEHEFGHRINHIRYMAAYDDPSTYMSDWGLNEGFADLSSNFIRDSSIIGIGFFAGNGSSDYLRNSNNTNKWPTNINPDGHITGEIISGAVWDLRKLIGHDEAERLFNLMEYQAPDGSPEGYNDPGSMEQAFDAVLAAFLLTDDDDNNLANGTPHADAILTAFAMHTIGIQNYFDLYVTPIADANTTETTYPVRARASYHGDVGHLDPNSVTLHYTANGGATSNTLTLTKSASDSTEFTGNIPKIAAGSFVSYYLTAATNYSDAGSATYPMYTSQQLSFLVGYDSKYKDPCESDNGWSLSLSSDKAQTGLWTRGVPNGTFDSYGNAVQQDTDHSLGGTECYLTGNNNGSNTSPSDDCVVGGSVTLTTGQISLNGLTNPVVRFWYYFNTWAGTNQGSPIWKTEYSLDGEIFKTLQSTALQTEGWAPYAFIIRTIGTSTSTIQLRFTTSDACPSQVYPPQNPATGTVVEAGIDDVEILAAPASGQGVSETEISANSIYPNPALAGQTVRIVWNEPNSGAHARVALYNALGENLGTTTPSLAADHTFMVAIPGELPTGVYYLMLQDGDQSTAQKLLLW